MSMVATVHAPTPPGGKSAKMEICLRGFTLCECTDATKTLLECSLNITPDLSKRSRILASEVIFQVFARDFSNRAHQSFNLAGLTPLDSDYILRKAKQAETIASAAAAASDLDRSLQQVKAIILSLDLATASTEAKEAAVDQMKGVLDRTDTPQNRMTASDKLRRSAPTGTIIKQKQQRRFNGSQLFTLGQLQKLVDAAATTGPAKGKKGAKKPAATSKARKSTRSSDDTASDEQGEGAAASPVLLRRKRAAPAQPSTSDSDDRGTDADIDDDDDDTAANELLSDETSDASMEVDEDVVVVPSPKKDHAVVDQHKQLGRGRRQRVAKRVSDD